MPVCKAIADCTEDVCRALGLELSTELKEILEDGIEGLLLDILSEAEDISQSSRRKILSAEDIMQALGRRKLPFTDILLSGQHPEK
jgi:histone H3/H4